MKEGMNGVTMRKVYNNDEKRQMQPPSQMDRRKYRRDKSQFLYKYLFKALSEKGKGFTNGSTEEGKNTYIYVRMNKCYTLNIQKNILYLHTLE